MNMKKNINELFKSRKNYQISKDTGIAQTTLGRYTSGNSKIGNMKLDHAITLNNYYEENVKMTKIMNEINSNYKVDGEDEKYATLYNSVEEIENVELFEDEILSSYVQKEKEASKLSYPIIVFDDANTNGGRVYESNELDDALEDAKEYFEAK